MLNTEQDYDVTIPFRHPVEFARILVCENSLWVFSQNCEWQEVLLLCSSAPVLVAILRYMKEHIPGVQLALFGSTAGDDPEG